MDYPYDIVSLVRNKTLSIEAHFVQEKNESPMKVFDDTYSRFTCNIIKGGATWFNIPIEALPGMRAKTEIAAKEQFTPKTVSATPASGEQTGPAFTTRFAMGNLKGKTPIEVLLEDPISGKETLNKQYKWLKENLSKYPNNKALMDAILDASKVDIASLGNVSVPSTSVMEILNIGCRPIIRKKREDGKCFIYEGKVTWDTSRNYPVCVTVKNYYANVVQNTDKTLNVNIASKDAEEVKDFNMTADEWLFALHEMEYARDCFKMFHFKEGWKLAEAAAEEARKAAKSRAS